jgi:hypothetical protein
MTSMSLKVVVVVVVVVFFFFFFFFFFFSHFLLQGWTTPYIDDVSWMIEELVYSLPLVVDDVALTERLWTRLNELSLFVFSSWDTSCCISRSPGGAWWDLGHTYKATASNAGAVNALAAVYFGGNGNQTLLLRAQLIFEFWRLNQVLESGQVLDGIRRDGTADGRIFTYNEGMMLRAIASLSKTNAAYNDYAAPILRFLLENETFPNGVLKEQHPCQEDDMDCQEFKGMYSCQTAALPNGFGVLFFSQKGSHFVI